MEKELAKIHSSIEQLAQMTAREFENMGSRFDSVNRRLDGHDKKFDLVFSELHRLGDDVEDIKITLKSVVQNEASQDKEIAALDRRVTRLDAKLV